MRAAAGYEVAQNEDLLQVVLGRIMKEHTARTGCEWRGGPAAAMKAILCDLTSVIERQEICREAA